MDQTLITVLFKISKTDSNVFQLIIFNKFLIRIKTFIISIYLEINILINHIIFKYHNIKYNIIYIK